MFNFKTLCVAIFTIFITSSCSSKELKTGEKKDMSQSTEANTMKTDTATFGSGCFWCVEAVFQQLKGVISVSSGYSGGKISNPTYREVCSGLTGHAEVCQIVYNPEIISYAELLEAFWSSHDPTTLNRQDADQGTQYRSVIFYHNPDQKRLAEEYKLRLNKEKAFENPVVTEIAEYKVFYKAEDYHQNYYNKNSNAPYCSMVIAPKLEKFRKVFKNKLK